MHLIGDIILSQTEVFRVGEYPSHEACLVLRATDGRDVIIFGTFSELESISDILRIGVKQLMAKHREEKDAILWQEKGKQKGDDGVNGCPIK